MKKLNTTLLFSKKLYFVKKKKKNLVVSPTKKKKGFVKKKKKKKKNSKKKKMQIGDLIFAPLLRSTPWDLQLARITGFQQQNVTVPTVSFEFLRETFGESSDRFEAIYIAPHAIPKSDRNFLSLPSN